MSEEAPQAEPDHPSAATAGAMALRIVELLADEVGPRRPTSRSERRAADLVRDVLADRGLAAELEPFRGYSTFGLPFGLIMAAAVAPALLPARMRGSRSALAALAAAGLVSEGSLKWTPLGDALSTRTSQNLVATIEPRGEARRTLCLLGHLDTSRSGLIFDPRFVGWLGRWITLNSTLALAAAAAEPFAGTSRHLRRALGLGRLVLAAGIGLVGEREIGGVDVPGANDNASGCAVATCLAAEALDAPLEQTRLVLCLTGCEEAGTLGARAFLADHETDGWLFLNFDNVGGGGTLRYLRREGVISHWDADPGLIAVAARVQEDRPELRMGPEDSPAGLTYDASPVLAAGGRALTLSIQDGFIPNLHRPSDTVANLDRGGVERALAAGREIVTAIDAGGADAPSR